MYFQWIFLFSHYELKSVFPTPNRKNNFKAENFGQILTYLTSLNIYSQMP